LRPDYTHRLACFQANYNNCSEVDLGSVEDGEDTAKDNINSRAESLFTAADTAAVITVGSAGSAVPRNNGEALAVSEVTPTVQALQLATQSITQVLERLAAVADQQALAAERIAAAQLSAQHHQQERQLPEQQQIMWLRQQQPQQQLQRIVWQQQRFQQSQMYWQSQLQFQWQQQQQPHRYWWQ
jgi:hypothetical protein